MTGDDQKKLDVVSNDVFIAAMRSCGKVRVLVSEEEEKVIEFAEHADARYAVVCDPIDGSSNLDAGVSVGTIFGVYKLPERSAGAAEGKPEDLLLKAGSELVASGFTMYGASAMLVITMKGGNVNGFTLDNALGEFILTHPRMRIPRQRAIYSVNEGNSRYWGAPVKAWIEAIKNEGKPYSARYIGSMVADAYRTLLYGGIFAYPADSKSPRGKLRILYECAPMAMVFENGRLAGCAGMVLTGRSGGAGGGLAHEAHARCRAGAHTRPVGDFLGQLRRGAEGHRHTQAAPRRVLGEIVPSNSVKSSNTNETLLRRRK